MQVGAVVQGRYKYMRELSLLEACKPQTVSPGLMAYLGTAQTPLRVREWERALQGHPDKGFVAYLLNGMRCGCRVGFNHRAVSLKSAKRNMRSAAEEPKVVDSYLAKERAAGRIIGPLSLPGGEGVHVSRFGVIPKPHQPGKWRLIVDLSHPKGRSVNDGVDRELCSLSYASIDVASSMVLRLGRLAELAKLDIASAYRIVPVHPEDRPLLGMRWNGALFVDSALPFGLRSPPKVFTAVVDGLEWILRAQGACGSIHYLDDFLFVGAPGSGTCGTSLRLAERTCAALGVPLALEKREGPAHQLGIELDSAQLELRLPFEKLQRLSETVTEWQHKRSCTKKELLSLIGLLQHATRIVKPGRPFLRRMIDLSTTVRERHHHIPLRSGFKSDLQWWALFMGGWNGIGMMSSLSRATPTVTVTSDASGNWGCGAFLASGEWFQCEWQGVWEDVHITAKELLPIVIACALWGADWRGKTVKCLCDNAAVVAIIRSGRSKHAVVMHLMRSLSLFAAVHGVALVAEHLPGKQNEAADALSRGNLSLFFRQVPTAARESTLIPQELLEILVLNQPDWTSVFWRSRFTNILRWA